MAGIIEVKDQGKLRIYDADNSHYIDIVVPSSVTANRTITIPDASFTVPQVTNATHSGEVTGATALTIADNIVDEANLKVSNTPTNGYALTAQSGNTGGLTWAAAGLDGWSSNSGNLLPADASKGIYLGVNSATAANLLDDYEEGTWTPVCRDASKTGTIIAIYTPTASYTKIGRIVNVQFTIRRNDGASLSDVLFVTGLPFTSSSSAMDANINGGVWVDNSSGDKMGFVSMGASVSHMAFRKSNTMDASIASDELVNGRYIYGAATYVV
jgi:hypothetical protein